MPFAPMPERHTANRGIVCGERHTGRTAPIILNCLNCGHYGRLLTENGTVEALAVIRPRSIAHPPMEGDLKVYSRGFHTTLPFQLLLPKRHGGRWGYL